MKLSFRWYGPGDPVTLEYIRQIPAMHSVVTAIYDIPVGEVWPLERIRSLKAQIEAAGLHFEVIESVPVHEDIKLGRPTRERYIQNYMQNIRNLAECGIRCICYNFMPVFDWTRTELARLQPDGSTALAYDPGQLAAMDPTTGELSLPGWDSSYQKGELNALLQAYKAVDEEALWGNLEYFLKQIIPVAAECSVSMAIHPDDPPFNIFGLPRIITNEMNLDRFLRLVDTPANGLAFCTGSLGCVEWNDIPALVDKYSQQGRIHFMHVRNVKRYGDGGFTETAHYSGCGSLNVVEILRALHRNGFSGYLRPDHGRMIWGETGRPGYGLYDRALGASYMTGIWETLDKLEGKQS